MQARGRGGNPPPIGIALEGDIGNRIDVALAIAMLNGLTAKGEARRIALAVSRTSVKAAQVADVIAGFYAGMPVGGSTMVGMPETGPADEAPPIAALLARTNETGAPVYTSNIARVLDTADNAVLIRNLLLAQNDRNAGIVLAGPATGLARLLALYGAPPQIEAKVARLVVAIGHVGDGPPDPTVVADVPAMRAVLADWPSPLVVAGTDVGAAVPYPGASIESDFAWVPAHPVADAYRVYRSMPYDAPAAALAATLYAVHPDDGLFKVSEPGTIAVADNGRMTFTASPEGRHRYLVADPAQKDRVTALYKALVSAPPAPRPGRRGNPPAQQQQQQRPQAPPPRPAEAKPPAS